MAFALLAKAIPAIGSFLAEKGMTLLSGVFSGSVNKGMESVAKEIETKTGIDINEAAEGRLSDEQVLQLKQYELEHETKLLEHHAAVRELEVEEARIHQKDRESARTMNIEAMKNRDPFIRRFIYFYAGGLTLLTFGYIFMVSLVEINTKNQRIVDTVLGFLLGVALAAIVQFFFGSSQGSMSKGNQMSDQLSSVLRMQKLTEECEEPEERR